MPARYNKSSLKYCQKKNLQAVEIVYCRVLKNTENK